MELLVKRDNTLLKKCEGKVFVDSDIPKFLQTPRVVPAQYIVRLNERDENDDLLITDSKDFRDTKEYLDSYNKDILISIAAKVIGVFPGLWSGYRSALVQDPETKRLFRLKGVSLNPRSPVTALLENGNTRIEGGQEKYSAEFEAEMSDRFNKILRWEGIEPTMTAKGMWKYPVLAGRTRPVASIFEVKGDTRLDELTTIIERLFVLRTVLEEKRDDSNGFNTRLNSYGEFFLASVDNFYHKIGYTIGRLKRLMDKSGQTWSSDSEQSNAHWGNVVLYNGTDKLKVGLVDFDASCDIKDFSKSHIETLQRREYETICQSFLGRPISFRQINGTPFANKNRDIAVTLIRDGLVQGFREGYDSSERNYTNEIPLGELKEVFALLRQEGLFSFASSPSPGLYDNEIIYGEIQKKSKLDDLSSIIKGSYNYQKSLINLENRISYINSNSKKSYKSYLYEDNNKY